MPLTQLVTIKLRVGSAAPADISQLRLVFREEWSGKTQVVSSPLVFDATAAPSTDGLITKTITLELGDLAGPTGTVIYALRAFNASQAVLGDFGHTQIIVFGDTTAASAESIVAAVLSAPPPVIPVDYSGAEAAARSITGTLASVVASIAGLANMISASTVLKQSIITACETYKTAVDDITQAKSTLQTTSAIVTSATLDSGSSLEDLATKTAECSALVQAIRAKSRLLTGAIGTRTSSLSSFENLEKSIAEHASSIEQNTQAISDASASSVVKGSPYESSVQDSVARSAELLASMRKAKTDLTGIRGDIDAQLAQSGLANATDTSATEAVTSAEATLAACEAQLDTLNVAAEERARAEALARKQTAEAADARAADIVDNVLPARTQAIEAAHTQAQTKSAERDQQRASIHAGLKEVVGTMLPELQAIATRAGTQTLAAEATKIKQDADAKLADITRRLGEIMDIVAQTVELDSAIVKTIAEAEGALDELTQLGTELTALAETPETVTASTKKTAFDVTLTSMKTTHTAKAEAARWRSTPALTSTSAADLAAKIGTARNDAIAAANTSVKTVETRVTNLSEATKQMDDLLAAIAGFRTYATDAFGRFDPQFKAITDADDVAMLKPAYDTILSIKNELAAFNAAAYANRDTTQKDALAQQKAAFEAKDRTLKDAVVALQDGLKIASGKAVIRDASVPYFGITPTGEVVKDIKGAGKDLDHIVVRDNVTLPNGIFQNFNKLKRSLILGKNVTVGHDACLRLGTVYGFMLPPGTKTLNHTFILTNSYGTVFVSKDVNIVGFRHFLANRKATSLVYEHGRATPIALTIDTTKDFDSLVTMSCNNFISIIRDAAIMRCGKLRTLSMSIPVQVEGGPSLFYNMPIWKAALLGKVAQPGVYVKTTSAIVHVPANAGPVLVSNDKNTAQPYTTNTAAPDSVFVMGSAGQSVPSCRGDKNLSVIDLSMARSVTTIPSHTFYDCTSVKTVVFPTNVEHIITLKGNTFRNIRGIEHIFFPRNIVFAEIDHFVYAGLKSVVFQEAPQDESIVIPEACFYGNAIEYLDLGNRVSALDTNTLHDSHLTLKTIVVRRSSGVVQVSANALQSQGPWQSYFARGGLKKGIHQVIGSQVFHFPVF